MNDAEFREKLEILLDEEWPGMRRCFQEVAAAIRDLARREP